MNEGGKEGDKMNQKKNNVVLMFFVLFSMFFGLRVMVAQQKTVPATKISKPAMQKLAAVTTQQPAVGQWKISLLPVPSIGKTYTIQQLFTLINTNNPSNTSTFIVPINGSQVVGDAQCWTVAVNPQGKKIIKNITGSRSAASAGLNPLINANLNASVKLRADPVLIAHLVNTGRLTAANQGLYGRIALYFVIQGYRFYIAEPFPALPVRTALGGVNPAQNIINKWNFSKTY